MRISGSAVSLQDLLGKQLFEVNVFSDKLGPQIRFYTDEFEYITLAPRSCCDTYVMDLVDGDLDNLADEVTGYIEFDGSMIVETVHGTVEFRWLSKKHGYDLRGVQTLKRKRK